MRNDNNENIDETYVDCSSCDYKYVSYGESDTGYEEWSCELLDEYYGLTKRCGCGTCPCMSDNEENVCPLKVNYVIERSDNNE